MHDRAGAEYRFNVFSATLGYSRRHLFRRSPTRTRDDLLACMYDVAVRLGGVPSKWLTDNMLAIAVMGGDGRRRRDPRVERFAREAGFETCCAPRGRPRPRAGESANRFLSRLAAYEGDFDGWEGLDEAIARIERRSKMRSRTAPPACRPSCCSCARRTRWGPSATEPCSSPCSATCPTRPSPRPCL